MTKNSEVYGGKPSQHIWLLVNGCSSQIRAGKCLAFAEAYFDDSGAETGDQRLFIAGYLNTVESWALFSDAWQECLQEKPEIAYLKMSEAKALQGQFRGWSAEDRDKKLRRLSFISAHFKPISFDFSVNREFYYSNLSGVAPRGLNPHFYCVVGIISTVARFLASKGGRLPIKFIFDKQDGVDLDIALLFDCIRSQLPMKARNLISGLPSFENDRDFLPLQAADLLAWHLRRSHEGLSLDAAILDRLRGEHVSSHLADTDMENWAERFSEFPGIENLQSKGEWQRTRRSISEALASGYIPPYGTRWKNFKGAIRDWMKDRLR